MQNIYFDNCSLGDVMQLTVMRLIFKLGSQKHNIFFNVFVSPKLIINIADACFESQKLFID